jgi:hypothetical protein
MTTGNTQFIPEQDAWLGKIQTELGVLYSNVWLLEIQKERLSERVLMDAELIAHLKERILKLEEDNTELKAIIQPHRRKEKNATDTAESGRAGS